jgi:hypothetical protein
VLSEFGLVLPDEVEVRVEGSNQKHLVMVMPLRPEGTDGWAEDQLTQIITRDCLIGVALPTPGVTTNIITKIRPAIRPIANCDKHRSRTAGEYRHRHPLLLVATIFKGGAQIVSDTGAVDGCAVGDPLRRPTVSGE